jgi:hypothetical protein
MREGLSFLSKSSFPESSDIRGEDHSIKETHMKKKLFTTIGIGALALLTLTGGAAIPAPSPTPMHIVTIEGSAGSLAGHNEIVIVTIQGSAGSLEGFDFSTENAGDN